MTMMDITPRELLEEAIQKADAAEQVLVDRGATASDDDRKAADAAFEALKEAAARFDRAEGTRGIKDMLSGKAAETVDGKTFDELAAATGIVNPTGGMTLGDAFVKSDAYEELRQQVGVDGLMKQGTRSRQVDLAVGLGSVGDRGLKFAERDGAEVKTLVTGVSQTSGGAFVGYPQRLPGVADTAPLRRTTVWDLCTKIPLTGDQFDYVEITGRTNNAAWVAEATSAGGLDSAAHPDAITDAAGGVKPESAMAVVERTVNVETIAHWIPITRRAAADAPQLAQLINVFLLRGLDVKIEDGLLNGTGTSPQIRGLINSTNAYSGLQSIDISVKVGALASYTRWDALAEAAALVSNATQGQNMASAFLVHPLDWFSAEFMLKKNSAGDYINGGPFSQQGGFPWGLRPVLTTAVSQGNQVVGDWAEALIGDREQGALYMTDSHSDFFIRNILVMLAEARLGFGVRTPAAFVNIVA